MRVRFVSQAQEPKDAMGDWGPKGRYKILFSLKNRNGQLRGAPLHAVLALAPQRQRHDALRPRTNSTVLTNIGLGEKIAKLVRRSSLGLVDMKPIRPINVPLTAWGTKGLMLPGSNWAGV